MSLSRRAIIHIGGGNKKIKNGGKINIGPRRLELLESVKKNLISGKGTKFSFLLDPRQSPKNEKINKFVDINNSKNVKSYHKVPVYDILIGTDEEIKKIDDKEKQELLAQKQEIKRKIKDRYRKKGEKTKERKDLGMGNFLQEIEFDTNYYKDILTKFDKFENKFFLPETPENRYNPFRFKVSENYKNIQPQPEEINMSNITIAADKWNIKNKLSVISNPIKSQLIPEFLQILKDVYRNAGNFFSRNLYLHTQHGNNEQAYFYIIQLALFKSYMAFVSKSKEYTYNKYDFSPIWRVEAQKDKHGKVRPNSLKFESFSSEIYKRNETNLSANYKVLDDMFATKLKREEKRINDIKKEGDEDIKLTIPVKEIWGQQETSLIISVMTITAKENHSAIFNKKDAIALYCYTMFEKKIEEFLKLKDFDDKISYKSCLKFFSLLKFVDPYIFTKHDIILNNTRKGKKKKNIDEMKMGETFFKKTDLFDMGKKSKKENWL